MSLIFANFFFLYKLAKSLLFFFFLGAIIFINQSFVIKLAKPKKIHNNLVVLDKCMAFINNLKGRLT